MASHIGRRKVLATLGGAAAAWPLAARAQQPERMRRVGVLMPFAEGDRETQLRVTALRQGLARLGWAEGRSLRIEHRWATIPDADSMRRFAKELVDLQPDLILTDNTNLTAAVLQQTQTIPIVFVQVGDPVGSGFVTSFPRPGGNATGFTNIPLTMTSKWLELLMEIAPRTVRVMFLFNPPTAPYAQRFFEPFNAAASSNGVEAVASPVHDPAEIETVIAAFAREPSGGLIVLPSAFMLAHRDLIIALAARHRLPAVYAFRFFAQNGGLISYGNVAADAFRQAATYIDRILRGAKPADLPVQAPVKFELAINLKTAKALGIDVPPTLLARADEVIE
jgi:putative tryptophan/tyrosine transport system substrate-binding protein